MQKPQSGRPTLTLPPILPVGSQVVTRSECPGSRGELLRARGTVGVIVQAPIYPEHAYRVRFPDGGVASLLRCEFAIRKHWQGDGLHWSEFVPDDCDLYEYVIYRCVIGSRAYGLDEAGSDTDRRGIYLPPAKLYWSLGGAPEQLENPEGEECYWELQKFLVLALKANPNVLECLYSPMVETLRPPADELLELRDGFLSRLVYQTYNGYVMSQFKKLEQDLRSRGEVRWKHAMHLVRLLLSGIALLHEGVMPVRVETHRERLLAVRRGQMPWEEVNEWRLQLHRDFDAAFAATRLPERPDYGRVNAFLLRARRRMVHQE
jgi:predicted nucleotidyltransferase